MTYSIIFAVYILLVAAMDILAYQRLMKRLAALESKVELQEQRGEPYLVYGKQGFHIAGRTDWVETYDKE
jgi:hypothetical protein